MESSTTSSPFSVRSTIASSPEALTNSGGSAADNNGLAGDVKKSNGTNGNHHTHHNHHHHPFGTTGQVMQGMQAVLSNLASSPSSLLQSQQSKRSPKADMKPLFSTDIKPPYASSSAAPSATGSASHGGSRTEPPKRLLEVDGLSLVTPSLDDIANSFPRILLQGDPQVIHKQRVETAIRVIIDIVRLIPPSTIPVPPSLAPTLPHDNAGNILASFERLANFRGLRLQAGSTTKSSSKKQLQAGAIPRDQLAFVETAVYMSGENGKRVYACKRCRNREERRRQTKDAARKKNDTSHSSTSPVAHPSLRPPGEDYITGENAHQYDPLKSGQVVEEPPWDPWTADWRNEIVLFNTPPEVPVKDGSCNWLPFRVVCYGKCHGEKIGFKIKFTLRTYDGRIIATETTHPIKITDDHKTDTKKPSVKGLTSSTSNSAQRVRKGRQSTTSSQRVSPAPSESELSVASEVGAIVQKHNNARQSKPYERPPSQSPAMTTNNLPFDGFSFDRPSIVRQSSASAPSIPSQQQSQGQSLPLLEPQPQIQPQPLIQNQVQSLTPSQISPPSIAQPHTNTTAADITSWAPTAAQQATVSPEALRRPTFNMATKPASSFTPNFNVNLPDLNGSIVGGSNGLSNSQSNQGNIVPGAQGFSNNSGQQSFTNGIHLQDDLFASTSDLMSPTPGGLDLASLGIAIQSPTAPMLFTNSSTDRDDLDLSTMASDLDNLYFAGSSHTSVSSSFQDDAASAFSSQYGQESMYSQSGLPPDAMMDEMIDFSGGESQSGISPLQQTIDLLNLPSHQQHVHQPQPLLQSLLQPQQQHLPQQLQQLQQQPSLDMSGLLQSSLLNSGNTQDAMDAHALLAQFLQQQTQTLPVISHVIPAEGHMSGGISIAIAGRQFTPETVILFGGRPAITNFVAEGFLQCILPASSVPGEVEVAVQGAIKDPSAPPMLFKYTGMDKEMMRLMLEVRSQHSSSDAAYRLVEHIAKSHTNSDVSDRSSTSPTGGNGSSPMEDVTGSEGMTLSASVASSITSTSSSSSGSTVDSPSDEDLQTTLINFLASLDSNAPGSLRRSGAVNTRNSARQTVLHIATIMGFHRLIRRLIVVGAQINLQDANGLTPLAFAALCGQTTCVRVLIEAGAAYDVPSVFGEMPLDLAKLSERKKTEALLLSAVWSTRTEEENVLTPGSTAAVSAMINIDDESGSRTGANARRSVSMRSRSVGSMSEIDDDNPSSGSEHGFETTRVDSEDTDELGVVASRAVFVRPQRPIRTKSKGKQRAVPPEGNSGTLGPRGKPSTSPKRGQRDRGREHERERETLVETTLSPDATPQATPALTPVPHDDPPPYAPPETASWMTRTLSNLSHSQLPEAVWNRLPLPMPSLFGSTSSTSTPNPKADSSTRRNINGGSENTHGWVAFPAPSWEMLHKMTSPEEVKLFTQAMAAAAFNAVVQSGATTIGMEDHTGLYSAIGGTTSMTTTANNHTVSGQKIASFRRSHSRHSQDNRRRQQFNSHFHSQENQCSSPVHQQHQQGQYHSSSSNSHSRGDRDRANEQGSPQTGSGLASHRKSRSISSGSASGEREAGAGGGSPMWGLGGGNSSVLVVGGSDKSRRSMSQSGGATTKQVVNHVKQDRMLYLFWLPVLLFVGFWLLVTALPIATGFCLIYARQITRAIKQRL